MSGGKELKLLILAANIYGREMIVTYDEFSSEHNNLVRLDIQVEVHGRGEMWKQVQVSGAVTLSPDPACSPLRLLHYSSYYSFVPFTHFTVMFHTCGNKNLRTNSINQFLLILYFLSQQIVWQYIQVVTNLQFNHSARSQIQK